MSEQDPWNGRYRRDPRRPPEGADEPDDPSSSVFSRPTRPAHPQPPPQDRAYLDPPASDRTMQYPAGQYEAEQGWAGPTQPQHPTQPAYDDPYGARPGYPGDYPTPQYPTEPGPGPYGRPGERHRPPPTVPRRSAERHTDPRGDRYPEPKQKPSRERRHIGFPLGAGAFFGVVGLGCFLAALMVLPWFEAGDQEVTLAGIRSAFTIPETRPEDVLPGSEGEPPPAEGPIPTPGEVTDAVEDAARDAAAEAAASAIDTGKARYLELYVERLWFLAAVGVGLAVLFSTVLAPRSFALSLLLGFRRLSGVVTVFAGLAHGAALWIVFSGDGAPDPAFGVWLGLVGLGSVLLGCIVGPKR